MPVFLRPYKRALTRKLHLYRLNGVTAERLRLYKNRVATGSDLYKGDTNAIILEKEG